MTELQELQERLATKQRTISRVGDEYLKRVLRADIRALEERIKELKKESI